jgi:chromosome transmission fidelity protein 18
VRPLVQLRENRVADTWHRLPIPEVTDVKGKGKATTDSMWTDRYRPRLYTDLIGDDRVHRTAMGWLKEWDTCVFKTAVGGAVQARKKALAKKRTWIEREENKENLVRLTHETRGRT